MITLPIAESGIDYETYNETIYFGSCDTKKCVNINIIDDQIVEKHEYFEVKLMTNTPDLKLNPMVGRVQIYDNESKNPTM